MLPFLVDKIADVPPLTLLKLQAGFEVHPVAKCIVDEKSAAELP